MTKNVLALFYDKKDRDREVNGARLEDEIKRGFKGTGINYNIRTASPKHEPWLAQAYMNERKYDGIITVAGLSCTLDVPNMLMEELYDNKELNIASRDWPELGNKKAKSKYYLQERPVPIIGVPTKDPHTNGELAFASMLMSSRPSSAACVGVEQGYQATQLMSKILTNEWINVNVILPPWESKESKEIGMNLISLLDSEFTPFDDDQVSFGLESRLESERKARTDKNTLLVCVYENTDQLYELSESDCVIGIYSPRKQNIDFGSFVDEINTLDNVIHTRAGVGENAAMFVAHCIHISHPNLKPSRFTALRRKKSEEHVKEYLRITRNEEKILDAEKS